MAAPPQELPEPLVPVVHHFNTQICNFNAVAQVISSGASLFPLFSEFQISRSTLHTLTTPLTSPLSTILFTSTSPIITPMGGKGPAPEQLETPPAKRARTTVANLVVDLTDDDLPLPTNTEALIQEELVVDPSEFINICPPSTAPPPSTTPPPSTVPPPPTTSSTPSNSSATVSDPLIRELFGGDHGAEVDSRTTTVVPPVDPMGAPQVSLSTIFTQWANIGADSAKAQPEHADPPLNGQTKQQEWPDLNMANSMQQ